MSFPLSYVVHWAFTIVLDLDRFAAGLIGEVLRSSSTRQQVICAALSRRDTATISDPQKSYLARELRFKKSKALIADTFGSTPEGFISCLAKMQASFETRAFYSGLYRLYTNPHAAEAVQYLNSRRGFDEKAPSALPAEIVRLASLGDSFLKRELIARLGLPCCAHDVEQVVRFLRRAGSQLPDDQLVDVLISADRLLASDLVIERCLSSHPSPALALSTHPSFELLGTSEQLDRAGREFNNCLGDSGYKRLLHGNKNIFLIWRGNEPAVMRLVRRSRLWWLQELKAARNREVSPATTKRIAAILEPLGVFCPVCDLDGLT